MVKLIKDTLIYVGKADLLNQLDINNPEGIKHLFTQTKTLKYINMQNWHSRTEESSKGQPYKLFKENLEFEPYLKVLPRNAYIPLINFRTGNHKFPVETGRWEILPHTERKCTLYDKTI